MKLRKLIYVNASDIFSQEEMDDIAESDKVTFGDVDHHTMVKASWLATGAEGETLKTLKYLSDTYIDLEN